MQRVLVLDDEEQSRGVLVAEAHSLGWDVLIAEDKEEAEKILSSDPTVRIAVIYSKLPGLSELFQNVTNHRTQSSVYFIVVAEREHRHEVLDILHHGAHDFVLKPYDRVTLTARLAVAKRITTVHECYEETVDVINRYASRMEVLAEERARALLHAERLSTLGVMHAGIAHEINNPMSFIAGNVQILDKMLQDIVPILRGEREVTSLSTSKRELYAEEIPQIVASVRSGIGRISKIIKALKTYAGKNPVTKSTCKITEPIYRAFELVNRAREDHITLSHESPDDSLEVFGDPQQLEQVFVNLLMNAIDALRESTQGAILVRTYERNGRVFIEVQDDGPGVPEHVAQRIWEPFFTTKEVGKGTGLGLSITHGIIKQHGGEIQLKSTPKGTLFVISLPRHEEPVS